MITKSDRKLAEQFAELAHEYDEAVATRERHNEGMALTETLKHSLAFESKETTRAEKLEHVCREAADRIRRNDAAGALLVLEKGLRL